MSSLAHQLRMWEPGAWPDTSPDIQRVAPEEEPVPRRSPQPRLWFLCSCHGPQLPAPHPRLGFVYCARCVAQGRV